MRAASQFTLAADTGAATARASIAASPDVARPTYEACMVALRAGIPRVESGASGADMQVALIDDGPVTMLLDAN